MCCLGFKSQLRFHPTGDTVGEGFISRDQGHKKNLSGSFLTQTEMWPLRDTPRVQIALPGLLVGSSVPCVGCSSDAQGLGRLECAFLSHRLPVALSSRPQEARALLGVVPAITPAPSVSEKGLQRI